MTALDAESLDVTDTPSRPAHPTQPLVWSVRRELWENRSIYVAPLIAAAVFLFGFALSTMVRSHSFVAVSGFDQARKLAGLTGAYDFAAIVILMTGLVVGVAYSLGAMHGERRDRSILFWKSLPVSDLTAVLAKASVPLVVIPAVTFVVVLGLQIAMLLLSTASLLLHGLSPATLWIHVMAPQSWLVLIYGLVVLSLWHAPIYAWLLLVSGWARRATFLWAIAPPIGLCILESIAFDTSHLASALGRRLTGGFSQAFNAAPGSDPIGGALQIDPLRFLGNPEVWVGLAVAASFLAAAVRIRRDRGPI